jgi:hypothetical protein
VSSLLRIERRDEDTIPEARQNDGGGFAPHSWDRHIDQAGFAFWIFGKPALIVERRELLAQCGTEELIEVSEGHSWRERFFYHKAELSPIFCFGFK